MRSRQVQTCRHPARIVALWSRPTHHRPGDEIAQYVYGKSSNTGLGDWFGHRMALDGDTLAVSAHLDDSAVTGINGDQADNRSNDSGAVYNFH